jgi:hypothetical protein
MNSIQCILLIGLVILTTNATKPENDFEVHWAINAGGSELEGSDMIHYMADDKNKHGRHVGNKDNIPIDLNSPRDAGLFNNIREHKKTFGYKISVPKEGNFLFILKWAEICNHVQAGDRLIDVVLNGKHKVISNLDVFKTAGGFTAFFEYVYFKIHDNKVYWNNEVSEIYDGKIRIDFVKNRGQPFVSALVLFEGKVEVIPKLPWTIKQEQNKCVINQKNVTKKCEKWRKHH